MNKPEQEEGELVEEETAGLRDEDVTNTCATCQMTARAVN